MKIKTKSEIRHCIRIAKNEAEASQLYVESQHTCAEVLECLKRFAPTKVGIYLSLPDELDTTPLLKSLLVDQYHQVLIPRVEGDIMRFYPYDPNRLTVLSTYGIVEPDSTVTVEEEEIPHIIIVPGVAFDRAGGRVGRGKGFYDKYITLHREEIKLLVGICYTFQLLPSVPSDAQDVVMDHVITSANHD